MSSACPACAVGIEADVPLDTANAIELSVPTIRCAACIAAIESHLASLSGVSEARVNLSQKRVRIVTDRTVSELTGALANIGFEAFPLDTKTLGVSEDVTGRDLLMRLGVAGFAMMNVMLLSVAVWSGATGATRDLFHLVSAGIALPAVLYSAQPFFHSAVGSLRVARLNMDVPISLAILLAGGMSLYEALHGGAHAYFDAALSLTFFLLIGRYLEHRTRAAARSAAKELAALEVHTAERKTAEGVETVPLDALAPGDTVLVATGVRTPADGRLLSKQAHTDRAFLTGESEPVTHAKNAALNAGEINLGAPLEMRITALGPDTRLHQITRMVELAEDARNTYTSLADRAARIYAPVVHLLALIAFVGWLVASGDVRLALNIAIAVLIITCPCALGLAVPAVSTAAISRLYRLGFLVKSGTALERLAESRTVVFDKTGTLTRPGFEFRDGELDPVAQSVAKALAQASAHPVARALDRHLGHVTPAEITGLRETKGQGVSGLLGGEVVALGRAEWIGGEGSGLALKFGERLHTLDYHETPVPGAASLSQDLEKRNFDCEILSGDTEQKTALLARALGFTRFLSRVTPEAKSQRVEALSEAGSAPCMVGDGLNDTVALTSAHASVAPGSALDAARNAADVVIVSNTLKDLPRLFDIARDATRLSRQNFAIAVAYNAVAIPIALSGHATPLAAALAMSLSSITVLLNAIRVGSSA
ncbi:MAG: heavy metal translocating P-type ATPase [Pseudomonadota bacterium]